ncbi:MAG: PIN domain-containing protein [Thermodesulfobacteriota bacterium]
MPHALPDPADEPFLEVAIAGQVACLITGNQIHFPPKLCMGAKVLSANEFLIFYKKQQKRKIT